MNTYLPPIFPLFIVELYIVIVSTTAAGRCLRRLNRRRRTSGGINRRYVSKGRCS